MKTIAVVNQKGGCGKTTTAVNLVAALVEQRRRVLMVDLDPQAHATIGLGHDPDTLEQTLFEAVTSTETGFSEILLETTVEGLTLAPSSIMLAGAEIVLARRSGKDRVMADPLQSVEDRFDVCVIDCAPSFGILTVGALVACTDVIVPVQAHYYSLEGLRRVLETIRLIQGRSNGRSAERVNILLTLVESRTTLSKQIQLQIREIFGPLVFNTVIHNNVRLCEAPSAGESVLTYAPQSRGAKEYRALAAEILGGEVAAKPALQKSSRKGIQKDLSTLFEGVWPTGKGESGPKDESTGTGEHECPAGQDKVLLPTT